ncbi:hypothetical protein [Absidia glauca]|uniref:Uncharacterized protein n=1 Tax=Absidia glauca TaxID=4829 RepID=A0A168RCZ2_ABSGL|nr:hypothetical protein [Absidia glauca]
MYRCESPGVPNLDREKWGRIAWSQQLETILVEANDEGVNPQVLLAALTKQKKTAFRKVQPWNAFLHEESKGVKLNKSTIAALAQKYRETGEEEKLGYVKRMTQATDKDNRKKLVSKSFRTIKQSMDELLVFGIKSALVATSLDPDNTVLKDVKTISVGEHTDEFVKKYRLGDRFLFFLEDASSSNTNTGSNINTNTNTDTNTNTNTGNNINTSTSPAKSRQYHNKLRDLATEKVQTALGAAFGIGPKPIKWNKVLMGPVYPAYTEDCVTLEEWPLGVPTRKRMADLNGVHHQKLLDGDVLFKRVKRS